MMRIFIMLVILSFYYSCRSITIPRTSKTSVKLEIIAQNLSEDGSFLSSKNDELILFILEVDRDIVNTVFSDSFVMEKSDVHRQFDFQFAASRKYLVVLVEMDSHVEPMEIQKIIELNYLKLIQYYEHHDLGRIEQILGDDDLLGLKLFRNEYESLVFEGTHRGDYYRYLINF